MRYKGKVYRPPSEAYSLIVQVTYGCSHNSCAFCDMYDDKHFSMRPMQEIREDFELARRVYHRVERVFLADGDALMRKTDELIEILGLIYGLFPECERVTCYASPTSLQIKSEDDLRLLRARGLRMVYMGLESGCDAVLTRMNKGHRTEGPPLRSGAVGHGDLRARQPRAAARARHRHGAGAQRDEPGVCRPADADGRAGYAACQVGTRGQL